MAQLQYWDGTQWLIVNNASNAEYDNGTSGLTATTVQGAIDELKTSISGSSTWGSLKGV